MIVPLRPRVTPDVLATLRDEYGLQVARDPVDVGGSSNLNLLLADHELVVRVHRSWVTDARLDAMQRVRTMLRGAGLPFLEPISTRTGRRWARVGDRLLEVEPFRPGENMADCGGTLLAGLAVLARIHDVLRDVDDAAASTAVAPNHVEADAVMDVTTRAARAVRSWAGNAQERWIADTAEELASALYERRIDVPRQLVHGDFWDNNVLFEGQRIVTILDLDMMGTRPRIDDLALTLYYVNSTYGGGGGTDAWIATVRRHVDAYDAGLQDRLSVDERAALPLAIVRGVLAFAPHMLRYPDVAGQRKVALGYAVDLQWSVDIVRDLDHWQSGLATGFEPGPVRG